MTTTLGVERGSAPGAPGSAVEPARLASPAAFNPYLLAYCAVALVSATLAFLLIRFTSDSAFVSWRYGQNLVHAGVWNWNPTPGYRVEAYTDPLYTALSVVPALMHVPAELFFKVLALGVLAVFLLVVRELPVHRLQKLVLASCALLSPVFFVHLFSGLETACFALLLAALFGVLSTRGQLGGVGHALALAVAFSRPEGMVYALAAEAWCAHLNRRRGDVLAGLGVAAVLAGYWALRALYFGSFFPNPYLATTGPGMADPMALAHALTGLLGMVVLLASLAGACEALRRLRTRGRPDALDSPIAAWRDATPVVLAAVSAAIIMVVYRVSALQMDFADRFRWQLLFPVALVLLCRPLFGEALLGETESVAHASPSAPAPMPAPSARWSALAVLICAVTAIAGGAAHQPGRGTAVAAALLACGCAVFGWISGSRVTVVIGACAVVVAVSAVPPAQILDWSAYRYRLGAAQQAVGRALAADPSLSGVVAVEDAGVIPFELRPDQQVADLSGSADAFYAHEPVPPSVADRLVAIVAGADRPFDGPVWWGDASSAAVFDTADSERFQYAGAVMYAPGYWLRVYVKPGLGRTAEARLSAAAAGAYAQNTEPSADLVWHRLFDRPFGYG